MMMKKVLALLLAISFGPAAHAAEKTFATQGRLACSVGETWIFSQDTREDFIKDFNESLTSKLYVRGFSNAMGMRRVAQNFEQRLFSEYWISRSLHQANLLHIAHSGFTSVASHKPTPETVGVQVAALECLLRIGQAYPSIGLPQQVIALLPDYLRYLRNTKNAPVVFEALHSVFRGQLATSNIDSHEIDRSISLLSGGGPYETLAKGMWAAKRNNHAETVKELQRFLDSPLIPAPLQRFLDTAHMQMARAYYSRGHFPKATEQYKLVSRKSNELSTSLSELAWSFLMADKYSEAIGTATNLQAGGLRHTFAPEAPMVMAMALNELCQYPESVRATSLFKKLYEDAYRWLTKWNKDPQRREQALYPIAVDFLKRKKNPAEKIPDRIASEWVRSPTFISSQEEINLIFDEKNGTSSLGKMGSQEQTRVGQGIIRMIDELRPRFKAAKAVQKPGEPLPKGIIADLRALKAELGYFRKLQGAAPVWRNILANYQKQVPDIRSHLLTRINQDLTRRTSRMVDQLEEIAENIQLIEVEIYNGASQDIIWQNAHPDYKELAEKMKDEHQKATAQKVWDWGHTTLTADNGEAEIWEDELGSFKADLFDNCSSKDRYLSIRMRGK